MPTRPKRVSKAAMRLPQAKKGIARTDTVVVVVGTPVDEFLGPSMAPFEDSVDEIAPHVRAGALILLRSTVFPGTTAYVRERFHDRGSEVHVAFCPERIAEGRALERRRSREPPLGGGTEREGSARNAKDLRRHVIIAPVKAPHPAIGVAHRVVRSDEKAAAHDTLENIGGGGDELKVEVVERTRVARGGLPG